MGTRRQFFVFLFSFLTLVFSGPAMAKEKLKVVPNKEVCMVNNVHFGKPQIPVEYSGRTYYGCCENCKATLQSDEASRTAIDPVSQKPVDKSQAVIGVKADGTVVYFENKKNLKNYK